MAWRKVGRPKEVLPKSGRIAKDRKDGMKLLASAVLKQWLEDGRPDDIPLEWVAVLKELIRMEEKI